MYRNLNLLADMGEIQRFSSGDGSEHFDYNTDPHYHFVCRTCGAIIDMPLDLVHDTSDLLSAPFRDALTPHCFLLRRMRGLSEKKAKIQKFY